MLTNEKPMAGKDWKLHVRVRACARKTHGFQTSEKARAMLMTNKGLKLSWLRVFELWTFPGSLGTSILGTLFYPLINYISKGQSPEAEVENKITHNAFE